MYLAIECAVAEGQPLARSGTLRLVVRDATDLAIPAATVTVTAADGSTHAGTANERGEVVFGNLAAGEYVARVESPGFTAAEMKDLRIRPGSQTSRAVVLQIAQLAVEIDVSPPDEDAQLRGAFIEQLTPEQIAALPDDPDELAQVLQQLVSEDADIRVNGFSGGRLPPGTQIEEIRVRYDAASGSGTGGPRIEVRTRPGTGRWRNTFNMNVRDEAMNARNAFSLERPAGQTRQYAWRLSGPLVKDRTGISIAIDRAEALEQQAVRAARPDGIFSTLVSQPDTRTGAEVEIEHALTSAQELRAELDYRRGRSRNQGISEFDLPERAYSRVQSNGELRLSHRATIRRRWVNSLRLQYDWQSSESVSASDATTIRVLEAFSAGGAQMGGGRRTREFSVQDELEFTLKRAHQIELGLSVAGFSYSSDEVRNANGTFTFASLEMYRAGIPTTFTQRAINASGSYGLQRFGWYLQDAYRVNRSLMINLAVRHDMQTHLSDWVNFAPRAGVSWTLPGRKTTLRASMGVYHQFFDGGLYEQTLWANGQRQRDIIVSNPGYPDPFVGGTTLAGQPPAIVRAHPGLVMPFTRRASVGVDRTLTPSMRLRVNYSHNIGRNLFRSRDLNAPAGGVRPDPSLRNITQLESTARSLNRSVETTLIVNHRPRRFTANVGYTFGEALNETDGALALPPDSFDLSQEWGSARQDIRHRIRAAVNSELKGGFRVNMNLHGQSSAPYNITTGLDDNRDGQTNERPAGVARNSGRGAATANLDMGITWSVSMGQPRRDAQRGGSGGRDGADRSGGGGVVRLEIFARSTNVLNVVNPQNFSGVLTSPFFGRATSASAARRLIVGTRIFF